MHFLPALTQTMNSSLSLIQESEHILSWILLINASPQLSQHSLDHNCGLYPYLLSFLDQVVISRLEIKH